MFPRFFEKKKGASKNLLGFDNTASPVKPKRKHTTKLKKERTVEDLNSSKKELSKKKSYNMLNIHAINKSNTYTTNQIKIYDEARKKEKLSLNKNIKSKLEAFASKNKALADRFSNLKLTKPKKRDDLFDKGRKRLMTDVSRKSTELPLYKTKYTNDKGYSSRNLNYTKKPSLSSMTKINNSQNFLKTKEKKKREECSLKKSKEFFKMVKKNHVVSINAFYQEFKMMRSSYRKSFIFDLTDDEGSTVAHFAVWHNNIQLFQFLLKNQVDFDKQNNDDITPLMLGALKGHAKLVALLTNITRKINTQDKCGNTALHYAVVKERLECVELLLQNPDIKFDIRNKEKQDIFDLAHPRICIKLQDLVTKHEESNNIGKREITVFNHRRMTRNSKPAKDHIFSTNVDSNTDNAVIKDVTLKSFIIHSQIGQGSFGEVFLVERKDTGIFSAMKVLSKQKIFGDNLKRYAITERNVLSAIDHPFIVKLRYAFQNSEYLFLIMDYCPGGDLSEYLEMEGNFSEKRTKIYMAEIITAIEELHKNNIIFRDLKPENIILDAKGHAMLIDFGLSKENVYSQNKGAKSFCGSVAYLAPEMVKKIGHGKAMDWYLLGVVMYELLVGIPPFYADTKEELFDNIQNAKLKIPNFLSPPARDLLSRLLQRAPHKRLGYNKGAEEIKLHPWFFGIDWEEILLRKLRPPKPIIKKVRLGEIDPQPNFNEQDIDESNTVNGWTFIEPSNENKMLEANHN